MAHTMRAILLAKATATSLRGRRLSNSRSHKEAFGQPGLACWITAMAPSTSNCRRRSSPARLMPPSRCLPPVERCCGTRPSQAAKWRPDLNWPGSTRSARFSALTGPMPGIAASRWLSGSALCCAITLASISAPRLEARDLAAERRQRLLGCGRHPRLLAGGDLGLQLLQAPVPLGRHQAQFGGMAAQGIDQLRALPDQQLARRQQRRPRLVFGRLHRHAADAWLPRRDADRSRVIAVILAALDKRLDVLRRDQPTRWPSSCSARPQ